MIEELEHRLEYVLAERDRHCGIAKAALEARLFGDGANNGSGAMLQREALARDQLDEAIPVIVADVDRAKQAGSPESELRAVLDRAVSKIMEMIRHRFTEKRDPAFGGPTYAARSIFLDELEERARSQVRQYWAGYLTPNAPPGSYTLNVTRSPGAAVQVGGLGNTQTVTNTTINVAAAQLAATQLAAELATLPTSVTKTEAEADLADLQRQLARKEPKPGLIKEMGKSLRTTIEKGLGGFASKTGESAAEALWEALDL